jgi:phage shock protein A
MSDLQKFDNFWKNPEGKFTKIANWAMLIVAGIFFYKYLPELIQFFNDLRRLAISVIVVAAIGFCFWDNSIRTKILIGYKALMTKVANWWVRIDPISTLEVCLDRMRDNLKKISFHITNLVGQKRNLEAVIKDKKEEIDQAYKLASAAKETGKDALSKSKSRIAVMTEESTKEFIFLHDQIQLMLRVLVKMEDSCKIIIDETEHNLEIQKEKFKLISEGHKALTGAVSFFNRSEEKALFDDTMKHLQEQMNYKLGEMERIMDLSKNVIDSIDLQNMIYDKQGMEALAAWELEADNVLAVPMKSSKSTPITIELKEVKDDSKYGSLFK